VQVSNESMKVCTGKHPQDMISASGSRRGARPKSKGLESGGGW